MIKNTFYNLPADKQERIIEVTKKEFLKGSKKKITINTVIEKAGISRGSFYQYFDDKLDLVELVTDSMINKIIEFIQNELSLNGGDIFRLPVRIFNLMTEERDKLNTIRALSPEANQNSSLISDYMQYRYQENNYIQKIFGFVETSNFSNPEPENIQCVITLLFDVIKSAILHATKNPRDIDNARIILQKKVSIIKAGTVVK